MKRKSTLFPRRTPLRDGDVGHLCGLVGDPAIPDSLGERWKNLPANAITCRRVKTCLCQRKRNPALLRHHRGRERRWFCSTAGWRIPITGVNRL
nr:Uncharacterised protein [Raoultella sp. NCTC 9187]